VGSQGPLSLARATCLSSGCVRHPGRLHQILMVQILKLRYMDLPAEK